LRNDPAVEGFSLRKAKDALSGCGALIRILPVEAIAEFLCPWEAFDEAGPGPAAVAGLLENAELAVKDLRLATEGHPPVTLFVVRHGEHEPVVKEDVGHEGFLSKVVGHREGAPGLERHLILTTGSQNISDYNFTPGRP
jgi:hypothetical protein